MVEVAGEWTLRLKAAAVTQPALMVYGGRSFQDAASAAFFAGTDLAVISAGLGLVRGTQSIPAYGLTLVPGAHDDVIDRCIGAFSEAEWWSLMNNCDARPLSRFVTAEPNGVVVVGLTSTYARLVERDLITLGDVDRRRLRIVGLSIGPELPASLRDFVLPYDSRLDGPDSSAMGTRGDFASRAIRHFVTDILPQTRDGDIDAHKEAVSRAISKWAYPTKVVRQSLPDAEIVSIIRAQLHEVGRSSTRMLRHLRRVKNIACEQTRFKHLFKRALGEVEP